MPDGVTEILFWSGRVCVPFKGMIDVGSDEREIWFIVAVKNAEAASVETKVLVTSQE